MCFILATLHSLQADMQAMFGNDEMLYTAGKVPLVASHRRKCLSLLQLITYQDTLKQTSLACLPPSAKRFPPSLSDYLSLKTCIVAKMETEVQNCHSRHTR